MTTQQTAPAPAPAQQQNAPAKDKPAAKNKAKDTANPETLGGVLIPGGIITGLIGLCWLAHHFGLGIVIAGLIACAMAATALIATRARRSVKSARRMAKLGAGGGGPGRGGSRSGGATRSATGGGSRSGGRSGGGSGRSGARSGALRSGGGSRSGAPKPGPNARKPGGLGGTKSPSGGLLGSGPRNGGGKRKGSTGGVGSLLGAGTRKGGGKSPNTRRGLLGAMGPGGSASPKSPRKPNAKNAPRKSSGGGLGLSPKRGGGKSPKRNSPKLPTPDKAAAKLRKAAKNNRGHDGGSKAPKIDRLTTKPRTTPAGRGTRKAPRRVSHAAPMGPARKGAYWAGAKLRKHTTRKHRMRIKKIIGPVRATKNALGRASTPLAYAWRYGSRAFLSLHMGLGSVRYTGAGPNWIRPLARVMHACTSPFARALAHTGSWGWLNAWIYTRTGGGVHAGTDRRYPTSVADARPIRPHTPVTRPAAAAPPTTAGGIPAMGANIQHSLPLVAAIDAINTASAMFIINPAEDMISYDMAMRQLAEVEYAMSNLVRTAAEATREHFKVNPAIPEAYEDTAAYMRMSGDRLAAIPYLFRLLHGEQLENIENPTPQAAKWDVRANQ